MTIVFWLLKMSGRQADTSRIQLNTISLDEQGKQYGKTLHRRCGLNWALRDMWDFENW